LIKLLRLKGVTKRFFRNGRPFRARSDQFGLDNGSGGSLEAVVSDLSLEVQDGEMLVLVGPSGSGKTTTLRMIAGLESCDSGWIELGGRDISGLVSQQRQVAMVFQSLAIYPHMTVYGNLAFGLGSRRGLGVVDVLKRCFLPTKLTQGVDSPKVDSSRDIETRVRSTAESLGIVSLLGCRPHQLSGGERQRVALGRAIVRNPAAFLFDEPLSGVDGLLRAELRMELREFQKRLGVPSIYVTHDQVEAMALADRIAVLKDGCLQQVGSPGDIYNRPANQFVARFFGQWPMNLATVCWNGGPVGSSVSSEIAVSSPAGFLNQGGRWSLLLGAEEAWLRRSLEQGGGSGSTVMNRSEGESGSDESDSARSWPGRRVVFGLRPESITVCRLSGDRGNLDAAGVAAQRADAIGIVQRVEDFGSHQFVHVEMLDLVTLRPFSGKPFNIGLKEKEPLGGPLRPPTWAVRSDRSKIEVGQQVGLKFERERLHFFDAITGQNLRKDLDETK